METFPYASVSKDTALLHRRLVFVVVGKVFAAGAGAFVGRFCFLVKPRASALLLLEDVHCEEGMEHDSTNLSDSASESLSNDEVVMVDTGLCGWLSSTVDCMILFFVLLRLKRP